MLLYIRKQNKFHTTCDGLGWAVVDRFGKPVDKCEHIQNLWTTWNSSGCSLLLRAAPRADAPLRASCFPQTPTSHEGWSSICSARCLSLCLGNDSMQDAPGRGSTPPRSCSGGTAPNLACTSACARTSASLSPPASCGGQVVREVGRVRRGRYSEDGISQIHQGV